MSENDFRIDGEKFHAPKGGRGCGGGAGAQPSTAGRNQGLKGSSKVPLRVLNPKP